MSDDYIRSPFRKISGEEISRKGRHLDAPRRSEAVRCDADGLLAQEREHLDATSRDNRIVVQGHIRRTSRGRSRRRKVGADEPDPAAALRQVV
jgi:hypothetical protein